MKQRVGSRRSLALWGVMAGLATAILPAASAHAALISTDPCDNATLTQPFASFGDSSFYKLVPGGDFETGAAGWTMSGKAHLVSGSEPFGATGSVGSYSMDLPAGASVQSPATCVDAAYPRFRFFARNDSLLSTLLVQVVYRGPLGLQVVAPVGTVLLSGNWAPSASMATGAAVMSLLSGGTTDVSLRFTELTGSSQIDDVYVDPRMK